MSPSAQQKVFLQFNCAGEVAQQSCGDRVLKFKLVLTLLVIELQAGGAQSMSLEARGIIMALRSNCRSPKGHSD